MLTNVDRADYGMIYWYCIFFFYFVTWILNKIVTSADSKVSIWCMWRSMFDMRYHYQVSLVYAAHSEWSMANLGRQDVLARYNHFFNGDEPCCGTPHRATGLVPPSHYTGYTLPKWDYTYTSLNLLARPSLIKIDRPENGRKLNNS